MEALLFPDEYLCGSFFRCFEYIPRKKEKKEKGRRQGKKAKVKAGFKKDERYLARWYLLVSYKTDLFFPKLYIVLA